MVLKDLEEKLERFIEGTSARAFKSDLQSAELGRRLIKELEMTRKVDPNGNALAANKYMLRVSSKDHKQITAADGELQKELATIIREHVKDQALHLVGPVTIEINADSSLKVGSTSVHPSYDERIPDGDSHCWLETQSGVRYQLENKVMTIGRLSECDIVIDDVNVSRRHAELRPKGDSFEIVDLGSTNGCTISGRKTQRTNLVDGDEIAFGPVKLWFHY